MKSTNIFFLLTTISILATTTAFTAPTLLNRYQSCSTPAHRLIAKGANKAGDNDGDDRPTAPERRAHDGQRRKAILRGALSLPLLFENKPRKANAAASVAVEGDVKPIADFPMRRLRLPKGGLGREYIIVQLFIGGKGPFDFMVDSGLTTEMITPHLQQLLNINKPSGFTQQGLSAGASRTQSLVELNDVSLVDGETFDLPSPLLAVVSDFPQEHMDPAHDPVEGMIGMEVLERYDVDFDFPAGRLRLYKPGTVGKVAKKAGLSAIDAVVVNETRLLGFRVVSASAPKDGNGVLAQPFLGVVDCGASFSVVNWAAAPLLGLPPKNDDAYKRSPAVSGVGVDGRPMLMPVARLGLSYCGNPIGDKSTMAFQSPPSGWKPWDPVQLAVGDLPVFDNLLGDGRTPYRGPAGIIGLDVLSQRRLILETSSGRQRKIYVGND